jgi:hypothetical protein
MSNSQENQDNERLQEADMQMLDSLLRQALRPEPEAREARIQGVLQHLDEQTDDPTGDHRQTVARVRRKRSTVPRWISLAAAASLVLAVGLWWQVSSQPRRAYATVQEALRRTAESGARHYNVKAVVQQPLVGKKEVTADLYVDGADRLVLRHPPIPLLGELWMGRNERGSWVAPTRGPVLVGDEKMLQKWMADKKELSTPYLHVTTILHRMSQYYDLEMLPDDSVAAPDQPDTMVRCRRVRGVLRDTTRWLPRTIDLWTDRSTGIARRLILDWELQPGQLGRSKVTFELLGSKELPPDWFEHSTHHGEGRPVFRPGL